MSVHRRNEVIYCFLPLEKFLKKTRHEMVFPLSSMHSINLNTSTEVLEITNYFLVVLGRKSHRVRDSFEKTLILETLNKHEHCEYRFVFSFNLAILLKIYY